MDLVRCLIFFIGCSASLSLPLADESKVLSKLLPRVPTFADVAENNGFQCEEHNITTSDGYILGLFRIPGDVKRPVLLMHGLIDSSDSFILKEKISLALTLAGKGYDVWAGNFRGNRYSRRHLTLDPNTDASFWNFSFHEMGTIDLPAIIDFVLSSTSQSQLSAVGHSQGTTAFYALGSILPQYNEKIKVLVSLAPIAYLQNTRGALPPSIAATLEINTVLDAINYQEIIGFNSDIKSLIRGMCGVPKIGYDLCFVGLISSLMGPDPSQIGPEDFSTLLEFYPSGSSKKSVIHLGQIGNRKSFAQFDYGEEKNLEIYGVAAPPEYNLTKVTFDVGLYVGANDFAADIEDVAILRRELPRVVYYKLIDYPLWNHFDFLYARDMPKYLFPCILELLSQYEY